MVSISLSCFLPSSVLTDRITKLFTEEGSRTEPKLLTRRQFSESWTKTEEGRKQERDVRRSASAQILRLARKWFLPFANEKITVLSNLVKILIISLWGSKKTTATKSVYNSFPCVVFY